MNEKLQQIVTHANYLISLLKDHPDKEKALERFLKGPLVKAERELDSATYYANEVLSGAKLK